MEWPDRSVGLNQVGHKSSSNGADSLHGVSKAIQTLINILNISLGSLNCKSISDRITVSHVDLRNEHHAGHEVFAHARSKHHNARHGQDTATRVHQDMTASLGIEDLHVVAHETVYDLERPWDSDDTHVGLNLGWFQLQDILVEGEQTEIKELFESLRKVAYH